MKVFKDCWEESNRIPDLQNLFLKSIFPRKGTDTRGLEAVERNFAVLCEKTPVRFSE